MAEKLGKAVLDLTVDDSKLEKGLKGGEQSAGRAAKRMEGSFSKAASGMESEVSGAAQGMEKSTGGVASSAKRDASRMESAFADAGADMKAEIDSVASDAGASLGGLGADAKKAGAAIAGALAVGQVVSTFDDAAKASGRLQARLGLTADEAEAFDEVSKRVYRNNFGESMVEAADTVGLVHQALGLQGKQLQRTTEGVISLSDAFEDQGADAQIITDAMRVMKRTYPGMSEKQMLDQIAFSFQRGAGTAGDLQDTLQEYPPHFQAIGLNSKDMLNFLTIGMQNGARNTDFLADAVKEFGIRVKTAGDTGQVAIRKMFPKKEANRLIADFGKGGKAGRDAFFTVMRQLSKTDNEQRRYNLAVELFGTKAEDMVGVLDKMTPAFLKTKDAQDESAGAADFLGEQYTGVQAKIESVKRFLETSFVGTVGESAGAVIDFGGQAGMAMVGLAAVSGQSIAGMVKGFASTAAAAAASTARVAAAAARQVAAWALMSAQAMLHAARIAAAWLIALGPIGLVIAGVIGLVALIVAKWDEIKALTEKVWGEIEKFFSKYWPIILGIFTGGIGLLVVAIIKNWDKIKAFTEKVWNAIKGFFGDVWRGIKKVVTTYLGLVKTAITTYLGLYRSAITGAWNAIKTATSNAWKFVRDKIAGWISSGWTAVKNAADAIWQKISGVWESVKSATNKAWTFIRDRIADPIGSAVESVQGFIGGLVKWIGGRWDAITKGVVNFAGDVRKKVVAAFKGVANAVIGFINVIIGAVNKIPGVPDIGKIDKLQSGGKASAQGVEHFAAGGRSHAGKVTRPTVVMGEDAPRYPEWVIPENPAYRGRAMMLLARAAQAIGAPGYARGGRHGDQKGGPSIGDIVSAPVGLLTGGADFILDKLPNPAKMLPGWITGMGKWVIDHVTGWIKDKVKNAIGDLIPGGGGPSMLDKVITPIAKSFGLAVTSGYRPGDDGWHGQDRARDYSNSDGPTPEMMQFAQTMLKLAPKLLELIYTPLGQAVKNGAITGTYAEADHYDHVHVAMAKGGVFGGLPYLGTFHDGGVASAEGLAHVAEGERMVPRGGRIAGEITITNWREGKAYFTEIADENAEERDRGDRGVQLAGVRP